MTFYALAKENELADGFKRSVKLPSITLLIFCHEGETFIIEDRCPHMDVPLATASVEADSVAGGIIRCRAHGIGFSLSTGTADGMWSDTLPCLKIFESIYRDYSVGVNVAEFSDT